MSIEKFKNVYSVTYTETTIMPYDDDYGNIRSKEYVDKDITYPFIFETIEKAETYVRSLNEFKEHKFDKCENYEYEVPLIFVSYDSYNDKSYEFKVKSLKFI